MTENPPVHFPYRIEIHCHRFAAWAASRAASVKGCRFSVGKGRAILEACGFDAGFSKPEQLPAPEEMDEKHRQWRSNVIVAAKSEGLMFTDGVAAKLINIYLKSRFVCGGHDTNESVRNIHPPIDDLLLRTLAECDLGGYAREWRKARQTRWSKFNSDDDEGVIKSIRLCLNGEPLWTIEEYWPGNQ